MGKIPEPDPDRRKISGGGGAAAPLAPPLDPPQNTDNSLYSGHWRDIDLVSSLARVRNSGTIFQSNIGSFF